MGSTEELVLISFAITDEQRVLLEVLAKPVQVTIPVNPDVRYTVLGNHFLDRVSCPPVGIDGVDPCMRKLPCQPNRVVSKFRTDVDDLREFHAKDFLPPLMKFYLIRAK